MDIKQRALRTAALKALTDYIMDASKQERGAMMEELLALNELTGSKSLEVKLPTGEQVATVSLAVSKGGFAVYDDRAFAMWVLENHPELVEVKVPTINKSRILKEIAETGEAVPGVRYEEGGEPKSFSVRFATGGRDTLLNAWYGGELAGALPDMTQRALEAGDA